MPAAAGQRRGEEERRGPRPCATNRTLPLRAHAFHVLSFTLALDPPPSRVKKIDRGGFSHALDLGVGHHAGRRGLSHENHVTQARKLGAGEFRALAVAAQFRRYLGGSRSGARWKLAFKPPAQRYPGVQPRNDCAIRGASGACSQGCVGVSGRRSAVNTKFLTKERRNESNRLARHWRHSSR